MTHIMLWSAASMDRVTGLAVRRGQPNGPSGWVRLGDREQDLGRPVAEGGPAVLDVGWMADRSAGPEPPGALVLKRHLDLARRSPRQSSRRTEPAAEVLVRGVKVMGFDRLKSEPWIRVRELLDEAWFVHLADSERQRRMVLRHKSPHMSSSDPPAVPTMGKRSSHQYSPMNIPMRTMKPKAPGIKAASVIASAITKRLLIVVREAPYVAVTGVSRSL